MSKRIQAIKVDTKAYSDQNPGTSGLRKKCSVFEQENYTENFIQAILTVSKQSSSDNQNHSLVVGGDGRYMCDTVALMTIQMAAANRIRRIIVGQNSILSTPALSNIIRSKAADGGIVLTASHNPGGKNNDFGIKYNIKNGGPAPESFTKDIYDCSKELLTYSTCPDLDVDLNKIGSYDFEIFEGDACWNFTVTVIDPVVDYIKMLREIFDFNAIKNYLKNGGENNSQIKVTIDSLSGVTGPYAVKLMEELEGDLTLLENVTPLPDFGGKHPDPNLTYAKDLVTKMKSNPEIEVGAAFDGDGDRNMILGKDAYFLNPSDSIAIIAANANHCIPYFRKNGGIKGVARSLPTSGALDVVAKKENFHLYITPTGWKFFGNLMDADKLSLCGEESFGTGSDHIREKDGIWAFLAWLSILAYKKKSIREIVEEHWAQYGRHHYIRYDYENLETQDGDKVYDHLRNLIENNKNLEQFCTNLGLSQAENFLYTDIVDGSVSSNQGLVLLYKNGNKFTLRKSGTGSTGVTLRLYFEMYTTDKNQIAKTSHECLQPLISSILSLIKIKEFTGKSSPSVIV